VVARHDLAVREERRRVVDPAVAAVYESHHDRAAAGRVLGEGVERLEVVPDERGTQHEVFGRVAGERELGEDEDVGRGLGGAGCPGRQALDVPVEVADRGVDLRECDPHAGKPNWAGWW